MTDLLDVSPPRGRAPGAVRRAPAAVSPGPAWLPVVLRGARSAASTVIVALVALETLVLLAWAADSRAGSGAAEAIRLGACLWLVSLHTRVHAGAAVVGLPPLLITLGNAWLVARATATLARSCRRPASSAPTAAWLAGIGAAVAVPYATLAAAVARVADIPTLYPSPLTAAVGGLTVAGGGSAWGLVRFRRAQGLGPVRESLPTSVRTVLAAAAAALGALGAVSLVLAAALLVAHHALAGQLAHALSPGIVGGTVFTLLQLAVAPLLVVGAGAWLVGPGFAVGAGTSVTPWVTSLGPVPALPVLAALPSGPSHAGVIVLAVPVLTGVLAALVIVRRTRSGLWWLPPTLTLATAATVGVLACLLAYGAGGPAGPGRLLAVGPSGWRVGLALAAELAIGGLVTTGLRAAWLTRENSRAAMTAGTAALRARLPRRG